MKWGERGIVNFVHKRLLVIDLKVIKGAKVENWRRVLYWPYHDHVTIEKEWNADESLIIKICFNIQLSLSAQEACESFWSLDYKILFCPCKPKANVAFTPFAPHLLRLWTRLDDICTAQIWCKSVFFVQWDELIIFTDLFISEIPFVLIQRPGRNRPSS